MDLKEMFDYYFNFYMEVFRKFTVFEGRARRREFWTFWVLNLIVGVAIGIVCAIFSYIPGIGRLFNFISYLASFAIFVITFTVGVRRLHDTNRSGWTFLLELIPLVGWIIVIIFLIQDSTDDNKYGPNPKKNESNNSRSGSVTKSIGGTVFCGECGKKNEAGSKFCASCGGSLQQKSKKPPASGAAKKTTKKK